MIKKIKRLMEDNENSAAKAAFYYLLCQLLVRGIGFLTTPIFSRLMSQAEYGRVSNFFAWEGVLLPIITLGLRSTINKSKYDFNEDNNSYLTTIYVFDACVIIGLFAIIEQCKDFFCDFFSMDIISIRLLFLYLLFYVAFDFQQIQYNIYRKYKVYVVYSLCSSFFSVMLSIILVVLMENKVIGRIVGMVIPICLLGILIIFNMFQRGKKFRRAYVCYGLKMGIPLIPSALSATLLSASDRIIIEKYCGSEQTALYSIPYTIASIAGILWTGLNQAWAPWMLDKLKEKQYGVIKKVSRIYGNIYVFIIIGLMLVAPEILLILGGEKYYVALEAIPPVILAMIMQFFYAFYFDTEYFYGETYIISLGTGIAAVTNIVLNLIFVPQYGYVIAAYTTAVGYFVMFAYHFCIVKFKLKKGFIFDSRSFMKVMLLAIMFQIGIKYTYEIPVLRLVCVTIYVIVFCVLIVKNRRYLAMIKKRIIK